MDIKLYLNLDKMSKKGGYLAFRDLDVEGWEPISRKKGVML